MKRAALCLAVVLLFFLAPSARADPPWTPEAPEEHEDLVKAAREYFDLDTEPWRGRKAFLEALKREAEAGHFWLKNMDALRWLVYQGRAFEPPMTDRKWRREHGISEYKHLGGGLHWIKSEELTTAFSLPRRYPDAKQLKTRFPRHAPYPLLITTHEKRDYDGQKYPGQVLLRRRYPRKVWGDLYDDWLILCPIAAAGNFLDAEGMLRAEASQRPYSIFWKHHHVDFERVVLDGAEQAFPAAAAVPLFFAGIVFRNGANGPWGLSTDEMRRDVRNFAPVPVYVVDDPKLAGQLRQAGHQNVTAGSDGADLYKWMTARRRVEPKRFEWVLQRQDQLLPYWVNLERVDWEAETRCLKVEVTDTEKEPNTIRIEALGVDRLALFLNDEIVDLDRPVRVEVNGHVEHDDLVAFDPAADDKTGRSLDVLFDRDPTRIRLSMFFGWLKTARLVKLRVRPPNAPVSCGSTPAAPLPAAEPPEEAPEPPVAAPPEQEVQPPAPPKPPPQERSKTGILVASLFLLFLVGLLILIGSRTRRDGERGEGSAGGSEGDPDE